MHLIIGAGLSGLYTAYRLVKNGISNIRIVDAQNRCGGKLQSNRSNKGAIMETGPARFTSQHTAMIKLLNELKIPSILADKRVLPTHLKSTYTTDSYTVTDLDIDGSYQLLDQLARLAEREENRELFRSHTIYSLLKTYYDSDIANRMLEQLGWQFAMTEMNAMAFFYEYLVCYSKDVTYGYLKHGFTSLIDALVHFLKSHNVTIGYNHCLKEIAKVDDYYICEFGSFAIKATHVYLAIPYKSLHTLAILDPVQNLLQTVTARSTIKIFLKYKKLPKWWDDLGYGVTTNTLLHNIVPYNRNEHIMCITSSGTDADVLESLHRASRLDDELTTELSKLFPLDPYDEIESLNVYYHNSSAHAWRPGVDFVKVSKQLITPFPDEHLHIVGETYSLLQGWPEGSLLGVDAVLES